MQAMRSSALIRSELGSSSSLSSEDSQRRLSESRMIVVCKGLAREEQERSKSEVFKVPSLIGSSREASAGGHLVVDLELYLDSLLVVILDLVSTIVTSSILVQSLLSCCRSIIKAINF